MKNLNNLIGTTNKGIYINVDEPFIYKGIVYQCKSAEGRDCKECEMSGKGACCHLQCGKRLRADKRNVIFQCAPADYVKMINQEVDYSFEY